MYQVIMSNLRRVDLEGRWGYEEVWGDEPRYHESRGEADACCARLNANDFGGVYAVEEIDRADATDYSR